MATSGLLFAGGVLVAVGAQVGTVRTFDRSPLGSVHAAVWVVLLPAVFALVMAARRPLLGLGLCAGAGAAGVGRTVSDLGVLTDPNSAIRPELFYELSTGAQPFTAAAGSAVLVAGDLLLVVAGVVAARALADRLALGSAPIFDPSPGDPASGTATEATDQGPELLAQAWAAETAEAPAATAGQEPGAGSGRNNGLIAVAFIGVLLLLAGSLSLPYSGGYLAARYLPAELGLAGIGSALAVALAATIAVLVAAVLTGRLAAALLGGIALTAAVPLLTAVLVRFWGAPVQLSASVWVGLVGAVVLAAAGSLGNAPPLVDDYDVPSTTALRRNRWLGVTLSLVTGAAALAAWRLPQLRYNGGADPVLPGGYAISAPLAAPFLLAAVVPLIAALLSSVPMLAVAGRAVATIGWLPLVFAATQTLYLLGQLVSSASVPNGVFAAPRWTAGAGLWWGVGGIATGIGAAVVSALAARAAREASTLIAQDESLARSRLLGGRVAVALSVVTVVGLLLPVYRSTAGSSATLLVGFDVRSWGVLGLGAGMVVAAVAGGRALRPVGVLGFLLAGASLAAARLVIPAAVRASEGFSLQAGWYVGWGTAALFVLAAVLLVPATRRILLVDAGTPDDTGLLQVSAGRSTRAVGAGPNAARQGSRPADKLPVGRRTSTGASPSKGRGRAS